MALPPTINCSLEETGNTLLAMASLQNFIANKVMV